MAPRIRYNRATGQYEVVESQAQVNAQAPALQNPPAALNDNATIKPAGITEGQPATQTPATTTQPQQATPQPQSAPQTTTTTPAPSAPQLDTQAIYDAQQKQIAAQKEAAQQEQAAMQSGIDQYNAMVQGWQREQDELAAQQAAADKNARVSKLITGIADGVAALSNLYTTTKGAANIPIYSGLDKYREVYERARQRREGLRQQLNLQLRQGNLSLTQLRQQQAAAKAKSDSAIAAAQANAEAGRAQGEYANAVAQQKERQYQQEYKDKRKDADRNYELQKQNAEENRKMRLQQMGLQYAYRQDALNQRKDEARVKAFTSRNGEDVSLDIDGNLYNFGYKPLAKQLVSVSESVYTDAKKGMQKRIDEINQLVSGKGKAVKGSNLTQDEVTQLVAERNQLNQQLWKIDEEWGDAKNANNTEVFASKYLKYSDSAKRSLIHMSKNYEKERNAAYGIADDDEDIDFDDPQFDNPSGETTPGADRWASKKRK